MNEQLENVVGGETLAEPSPGRKALVVFGYALALFGAIGIGFIIPIPASVFLLMGGAELVDVATKKTAWADLREFSPKTRKEIVIRVAIGIVGLVAVYFTDSSLAPAFITHSPRPAGYVLTLGVLIAGFLHWRWVRKLHAQNRTNPSPA